MEPPSSPSSRSKSSFSGVFTLKTQAEANELARAVTTLVERGVNIFYELERGTSGEIEDTLKAVIRLSHSFQDLTLDDAEREHCEQVIRGMNEAEEAVQREVQTYRRGGSKSNEGGKVDARNQLLAQHMQTFLSHLAELCDMMEDNQNKRGLLIIKQAILHLQQLRDPKYADFNAKLKLFGSSTKMVVDYVMNREAVATPNTPLQIKLASLHKRIAQAAAQVSSTSMKRNSLNNQADPDEKEAVVALVHCLKEAGEIFAVKEGRIKTSFTFSYEKLDQALSSLSQAVQSGSRDEATTQARVIVDVLKRRATLPQQSEAVKKASVMLVQATKEALDNPSDEQATELDKVMESVKMQFLELSSPTAVRSKPDGLKLNLMAASTNLSNCLSDLTSPRSPRVAMASPRVGSPSHSPSPRHRLGSGGSVS